MAVYLTCAGSASLNGIYDQTATGVYSKRASQSASTITYNGSTGWVVADNADQYYFLSGGLGSVDSEIVSTSGWATTGLGLTPAPKTYSYVWSGTPFTTIVVSGAGSTEVNGTYTKGYDNSLGTVYYHSNNLYYIVQYSAIWRIWRVSDNWEYYYANLSAAEPPSTEGGGNDYWVASDGDTPVPTSSLNMTSFCSSFDGGGVEGGSGSGNYFIYRNNNASYIKKTGNNFFIRKT